MPDRSHFQETGVVNIWNAKVSKFQNADNQLKFFFLIKASKGWPQSRAYGVDGPVPPVELVNSKAIYSMS